MVVQGKSGWVYENGGYLQFLRFLGFYLQLTRENMQEGSEYVFTP